MALVEKGHGFFQVKRNYESFKISTSCEITRVLNLIS